MKIQSTNQTRIFIPGARPPKKLSSEARKKLEEMEPSVKAHEMAARFAKSNVLVSQ